MCKFKNCPKLTVCIDLFFKYMHEIHSKSQEFENSKKLKNKILIVSCLYFSDAQL